MPIGSIVRRVISFSTAERVPQFCGDATSIYGHLADKADSKNCYPEHLQIPENPSADVSLGWTRSSQ